MSRATASALKQGTKVEVYKDGMRRVFHRTPKECFTHPDTPAAREACETCAVVEPAASAPERKPHRLDEEADELFARCAEPSEFDALRRRGWPGLALSASQLLPPCGAECGVCNPTSEIIMASRRRARRNAK